MDAISLHQHDPPEGTGIYALPFGAEESLVQLLPVPFEATVSYGAGTAGGPRAILDASEQIDLFDLDYGRAYRAGIHMRDPDPKIEALSRKARGKDEHSVNEDCARMNSIVYREVSSLLRDGRLVGVVGGDHSAAFPAIRAHADHYGEIGILQFDAHMDLREAYQGFKWSHASVMFNVLRELPDVTRIVQIGVRDFCDDELRLVRESRGRVTICMDTEIRDANHAGGSFEELARAAISNLPRLVYVSFDIDGLDPRLCPNTGTPVPGGLSFHQAALALKILADSGRRIVGFDLCEVAPGNDDQWDGNVGCRILYKLIGAAVATRVTSLSLC